MGHYGRWVLFAEDVAAIWTEELRAEKGPDAPAVSPKTVYDFLRWSKPTPKGARRPHRYADHPMPYPREARGLTLPLWSGEQETDHRQWWHDRRLKGEPDPGRVALRKAEWKQDTKGLIRPR